MRFKFIYLSGVLFLAVASFLSCSKDVMEPELFGDIEGMVIDSITEEGVPNVGITTAPASDAILTNSDGSFSFTGLPTGNYTIQARKNGFVNNSVSVSVRDGKTSVARILLKPEEDDPPVTEQDLDVIITSWFNESRGDSSFVDVEYRVSNLSTVNDIDEFEIYFEIETGGDTNFFYDVSGTNLKKGQNRFGGFSKYIRTFTATNVAVIGVWVPE